MPGTLGNCCSEIAVSAALKKHFPKIGKVEFNNLGQAKNDLQLDLQCVFSNFPGENIDWFALSNAEDFAKELSDLDTNKIYCVRSGQNDGAGHFYFMYFNKKNEWRLSSGQETDERLATVGNNQLTLDRAVFQKHFKVTDAKKCGPGNGQYSLRLNELTVSRTIAAMNYIAIFRSEPIGNGTTTDYIQDIERHATNKFQGILDDNADALFLGLDKMEEVPKYWQVHQQPFPNINNTVTAQRYRQEVYQHLLCIQNKPKYLDHLLSLNVNINAAVNNNTGDTLLHLAVQANSLAAVRALLSNDKIDTEVRNNKGQTALDLLQIQAEQGERKGILQIRNCFTNKTIASVLNQRSLAKQELSGLLFEACHWNNYMGIPKLLEAGADVYALTPKGKLPIDILIDMARETEIGWTTIEEALLSLFCEMIEKDPDRANQKFLELQKSKLSGKALPEEMLQELSNIITPHKSVGAAKSRGDKRTLPPASPTLSTASNPIVNTVTTASISQIAQSQLLDLLEAAIKQNISAQHINQYKCESPAEQSGSKPTLQLTYKNPADQSQSPEILLTAEPDKVHVHRGLIKDKNIQQQAKIMIILNTLGIPPNYPERLYISKPKSELGQAVLAKYQELKAEHDKSLTNAEGSETSLRI